MLSPRPSVMLGGGRRLDVGQTTDDTLKQIHKQTCSSCPAQSRYTCPRCTAPSCSVACAAHHKAATNCDGVRNPAQYVPINQYRWGTMMSDYVFLEDLGRRATQWRRDIPARGRPSTKRDLLRSQLESRHIDLDLLPQGMARQKLNQSRWDSTNQTGLLTIEFKFHQHTQHPFVLLTHHNDIAAPLLSVIRSHVKDRPRSKKDNAIPSWVRSLVSDSPQCVMPAKINPLSGTAYITLTPLTEKLSVLLRGTHFVEFPTIEVWDEFRGTIIDTQGAIVQHALPARRSKRRKLNPAVGKMTMDSLVGGYGSEDEDEDEGGNQQTALSALGGYDDDDDEGGNQQAALSALGGCDDDDDEGQRESDDLDSEELNLEPAALLELIRNVHGHTEDDDVSSDEDGDITSPGVRGQEGPS